MTERELYGYIRDQHRGVLVRPAMVEMTGDFMAGALLSQVVFWYATAREGRPRGSVGRDGRVWLVRRRADWQREIGFTPREVDRAIRILEETGYIETRVYRFNGSPTLHLSPNADQIARYYGFVISKSPIGDMEITDPSEHPISPIRDIHFTDAGNSSMSENPDEEYVEGPEESFINNGRDSGPVSPLDGIPQETIDRAVARLRGAGYKLKDLNALPTQARIATEIRKMADMSDVSDT